MNELVSIFNYSDCPTCGEADSIVAVDIYGNRIYYSDLFDSNGVLSNRIKPLEYMECKKCKQRFIIDWRSLDRKPRPYISEFLKSNYLHLH